MIHCEIFAQTGFLLKVQLKLILQQLFTLHWYRRDYSTCQHGRQMEFSRGWGNNEFFQGVVEKFFLGGTTVVKFDFINSKLKEKHFLTKNLMKKY